MSVRFPLHQQVHQYWICINQLEKYDTAWEPESKTPEIIITGICRTFSTTQSARLMLLQTDYKRDGISFLSGDGAHHQQVPQS
jgi:hypothetical protein